ncbi:ATP-binding protein [Muricauda sp. 334s03]|uniref:histidine kinase n=1 Tax=Flagellimonas yonaguniensis TaxID=3031325 RepID=A0ABT5XU92_9FLAO|nr:HAMP domain-containing sensor histidine kinase [[Muricauda] yonaguniensis]MDF0714643.1 ATP-binding protein [[Muricauda] yonaguniensis]
MITLVVLASVLIAGVTVYQYKEQGNDYHNERLERKEEQLMKSINYTLKETTYPISTENLHLIFSEEIYEIANIQNVNFNIYDLEGNLIKSSRPTFESNAIATCLDAEVLNFLRESGETRFVEEKRAAGDNYQSTYTYIHDLKFKPIGIMNLPYFEDNTFNNMELKEFLFRLGMVYVLMLIIAIILAYFISKYITRSLQTISDKINRTNLTRQNEKIYLESPGEEIGKLVDSYNRMIDELEESAVKLARSEREQAWREMAKQVAHEIKNPLTPLRLSVQSFERKFDPNDPDIQDKVREFSKTLIQQIDTMSNIATAFSSFADMPAQQNETLNVVKVVRLALEIFQEDYIHFIADEEEIVAKLDRTQLIRVITNLVKNAIQAVPDVESPRILVSVATVGDQVKISIADNGTGIADEYKNRIFEPKFTTKSSGTGLGLGMVKNIVENYGGTINFTSQVGKGTVFCIQFPKEQKKTMADN